MADPHLTLPMAFVPNEGPPVLCSVTEGLPDTAPQPIHRTLIVVPNNFFAGQTARQIAERGEDGKPTSLSRQRSNRKFHITYPGQLMAGFRFANIIISASCHRDITRGNPHAKQWLEDHVLCRLMPGGQLIIIP